MDTHSLVIDQPVLAARVAEILTLSHNLAYAHVDPQLYIQQSSPNFAPMLQITADADIIRQHPLDHWLPALKTAVFHLQDILKGQLSHFRLDYGDQTNSLNHPTTSHFTLHFYPLDQHNAQLGLLLILENQTSQHRILGQNKEQLMLAQQQLAKANAELHRVNQIKTLFMSMAAHDLRTPLTTIFGFADMLLEDLQLGDQVEKEILAVIRAQSERLHRLIADLLDVERIERGKLTLKSAECDLNKITFEVLQSLKPLCEMRHLVLVVNLPNPPLLLCGDAARIWQILYNLISNAIKYTAERSPIQIDIYQQGEQAILKVADSGRGMTKPQLARLFDLYYRTAEAKSSTVLGSGLGLYIVKTMVEAHNGTVTVESEINKGTTFTVHLPLNLETKDLIYPQRQ